MTLRNSLLQPIFDAATSRAPISDEKLLEIKSLLKAIQTKAAQGENISINDRYIDKDTALIIAARKGREEIIQLLLGAKAKTDLQNRFEATALMEAVEKSNLKITELLLDAGAQIENGTKYTVLDRAIDLHLSALQDRFDNSIDLTDNLAVIRALLKHGAFIHNPGRLFELLSYCDARDPNTLDTLHFLHEHLKLGYGPSLPSLLNDTKKFTEELDIVTEARKKDFIEVADMTIKELLPSDLNKIVYSYDAPLERLGFFKWQDPLPEKKTQPNIIAEEKTEPVVRKSTCSVM